MRRWLTTLISQYHSGQFEEYSDAFASELQARGIEHGDRVAMYLQNIPQVLTVVSGRVEVRCGDRAV